MIARSLFLSNYGEPLRAKLGGVEVAIGFDKGEMTLTIKDNGKGFEMSKTVGEFSRTGKLGLIGMEERTRLLGGSMKVRSEPSKGTTVTVDAPI